MHERSLTLACIVIAGKVGWMTILVWCCYPCVWLFSEGFASFSVSFEVTMYAILDVINKVRILLLLCAALLCWFEKEMS